jgi:hypothetical protein
VKCDITEGLVKKGGLNSKPKSERPSPPKGQGRQPTNVQQVNFAVAQAYKFSKLCKDSKANGTMHSFVEWLEQQR